jgi:hypothetical protein
MESKKPLAPTFISSGSLSSYRDMIRALETIENVEYRYVVCGNVIDEGNAALVKLMADPDSATLIVNGCLFLTVGSFRYLDFAKDLEDRWVFNLHGDDSSIELVALPETTEEAAAGRPHLLTEEETGDFESLILLDDEDEEE